MIRAHLIVRLDVLTACRDAAEVRGLKFEERDRGTTWVRVSIDGPLAKVDEYLETEGLMPLERVCLECSRDPRGFGLRRCKCR